MASVILLKCSPLADAADQLQSLSDRIITIRATANDVATAMGCVMQGQLRSGDLFCQFGEGPSNLRRHHRQSNMKERDA